MPPPAKRPRSGPTRPVLLAAGLNLICGGAVLTPVEWLQTADLIAFNTFAGIAHAAPIEPIRRQERRYGGASARITPPPADTPCANPEKQNTAAPIAADLPTAAGPDLPHAWPWADGLGPSDRSDTARSPDVPVVAFLPWSGSDASPTPDQGRGRDGDTRAGDAGRSDGTSRSDATDAFPEAAAPGSGCGAAGCDDPAALILPKDPAHAATPSPAAVPEPSGLPLLAVAMVALAWARRRRHAAPPTPARTHTR